MGVQKEASHKYGAKLWNKSVVIYLWAADRNFCKAFANSSTGPEGARSLKLPDFRIIGT